MEDKCLLKATGERLAHGGVALRCPSGLWVDRGEVVAVVGENGSGKTTLANVLAKSRNINPIACREGLRVRRIEFSDIHSLTGCRESYYQQRFEATMNDDMPTVGELIGENVAPDLWERMCRRLSLHDIAHKKVNFLSSGELRKFLVINLMADVPDLLILDNPYIGLDAPSRSLLNDLLCEIAASGVAVMLLLCNPKDLPGFADRVIPMKRLEVGEPVAAGEAAGAMEAAFSPVALGDIPCRRSDSADFAFSTAFELRDCRVAYGRNVILEHVDWRVARGERWALLGENGSGKSTLLSLVCADNPQSYCNDITLFDRRRGTGESVWDIKRRIGYVSPEMHLHFREAADTLAVVASGLRDTEGFFRKPTEEQLRVASEWMRAFGIDNLSGRRFPTLSSGEQRMALLVRTLIKRPPLLVLDEPLHGLDRERKRQAREAIESIARADGTTMVYVTHYVEEIPDCVDKRKLLKKIRNQQQD